MKPAPRTHTHPIKNVHRGARAVLPPDASTTVRVHAAKVIPSKQDTTSRVHEHVALTSFHVDIQH